VFDSRFLGNHPGAQTKETLMVRIRRLRHFVGAISLVVLTYGAHFGLHLGSFLPCFSCPYVSGCAGNCFLMGLQGSWWGLEAPMAQLIGVLGFRLAALSGGFLVLVLLLSKTWCGWLCPFGVVQDWAAAVRKKLAITETRLPWTLSDRIKPVKYVLLIMLLLVPLFIANLKLHPDFSLLFCQICPAKPLMPLFECNPSNLSIDTTNVITLLLTSISVIVAAVMLVGMFCKERFFCLFCPMLALISLFERIGFMRLQKNVDSCIGCGNCQRLCPMDIRTVHLEQVKRDVLTPECLLCMKCVEGCPVDNTLTVKYLNHKLVSSSSDRSADSVPKGM